MNKKQASDEVLMVASRKIALIDLDARRIETVPIPDTWRRNYIGGRGLGTYLFCRHAARECHPLAPGNPVVISAGLLGGTLSSACTLTAITTQSPLTGFMECAFLPGRFAAEMRWAGFDHLVMTGRSRRWASLYLHDGTVQILNTPHLRGIGMTRVPDLLRRGLQDDELKTIAIGPAGENKVHFATLGDEMGHVTGRTGMGAVLGAKRVKALACRGTLDIEIKFPEQAIRHHQARSAAGQTPTADSKVHGRLPLAGNAGAGFSGADPENEQRLADAGLDLETLIQTIRSTADTAGLDPEMDVVALAELVAQRKGRGRRLADGPLAAAAGNGGDMPILDLIAVYREKEPEKDPVSAPPPFAAPEKSSAQYREKPGTVAHLDLSYRLLDCLGDRACAGVCPVTGRLDMQRAAELIRLNVGLELKTRALQTAAYRCYALERIYNLGAQRAARRDDRHARVLDTPGGLQLSPAVWEGIDLAAFKRTVSRFYRQNGWDRKALVKKQVFERLGMPELWPQFK
jgi:aldehyde:ferredoxin oxidoreductase